MGTVSDVQIEKAQQAYERRMKRYEAGKKAMQAYATAKNHKEAGIGDWHEVRNMPKNYRLIQKYAGRTS